MITEVFSSDSISIRILTEEIKRRMYVDLSIILIGRKARLFIYFISGISVSLFIVLLFFYMLGFFKVSTDEDLSGFLSSTTPGWILLFLVGLVSILLFSLMIFSWIADNRWKDLRYKMAFYLYHSRVRNGDRIQLEHLARVGVCNEKVITKTLENMIARGELKGFIDYEEGIYIHKVLTRRGLRFLMALPPAAVPGLEDVKRWALGGYTLDDERGEAGIDELPAAGIPFREPDPEKIMCPSCGRMNFREHHFCTYCGEVL